MPGRSNIAAPKVSFTAPALMDSPEPAVRTIPRELRTPSESERPRKREVPASLPVVGGPADDEHPERPVEVSGSTVLSEQRLTSPLGLALKITKLYLTSGVTVWGCWDCLYVAEARGTVMAHRNARHGTKYGKKRAKVEPELVESEPEANEGVVTSDEVVVPDEITEPADAAPDAVAEPADAAPDAVAEPADAVVASSEDDDIVISPADAADVSKAVMQMTIDGIRSLYDIVKRLEKENEQLRQSAVIDRASQYKIDVFEANRAEISELRTFKKLHGECDYAREEIKELRAWRRKMINRMGQLGFKLEEN